MRHRLLSLRMALQAALKFISRRERFEAEVRSHLTQKGFPVREVEAAVHHLVGRGMIDDPRCAELVVRRLLRKGFGRKRILIELESRQAPISEVEHLLQQDEHCEVLLASLAKHFPNGARFDQAVRFLCSRGFDQDSAETAAETWLTCERSD